jgi:hypothetical protein
MSRAAAAEGFECLGPLRVGRYRWADSAKRWATVCLGPPAAGISPRINSSRNEALDLQSQIWLYAVPHRRDPTQP